MRIYLFQSLKLCHFLPGSSSARKRFACEPLQTGRKARIDHENEQEACHTLLAWGRKAGKTSLNLITRSPRAPGRLLIGIPSPPKRRSYPGLTTSGHGKRRTRPLSVGTFEGNIIGEGTGGGKLLSRAGLSNGRHRLVRRTLIRLLPSSESPHPPKGWDRVRRREEIDGVQRYENERKATGKGVRGTWLGD